MDERGTFLEAGLLLGYDARIDLAEGARRIADHLGCAGCAVQQQTAVSRTEIEFITEDFAFLLYLKLPELREETDSDGKLVEIESDDPEIVLAMDVFAASEDDGFGEDAAPPVSCVDHEALMAGITHRLAAHYPAHSVRWLAHDAILPAAVFLEALAPDTGPDHPATEIPATVDPMAAAASLDWAAMGEVTLTSMSGDDEADDDAFGAYATGTAAAGQAARLPVLLLGSPVRDEADLPMRLPPRRPEIILTHRAVRPGRPERRLWSPVELPLARGAGLAVTGMGLAMLFYAPHMANALDAATAILP